MANICDYSKTLKGYSDKWVALSANGKKVIAVGDSVKEVMLKASEHKETSPILTRTSKGDGALIL